jgi:hypothetical protein
MKISPISHLMKIQPLVSRNNNNTLLVLTEHRKLEISSSLDTRGCIFRRGELGDIFNIEIRDQYVLATFVYSELVLMVLHNLLFLPQLAYYQRFLLVFIFYLYGCKIPR